VALDHLRIAANLARHKLISALEFFVMPVFLVSILVLLGFTIWKSIQWFNLASTIHDVPDRITAENEIMRTFAQVFGGAFVLTGLYFSAKSVFVSKEGQIAERFTAALENLSDSSNVFKRIGGIHALERIAQDSPHYHWTIMEIFVDYIRNYTPELDTNVAADIQAILTVLGRRTRIYKMGENRRLNLRGASLQGVDLRSAHLEGAILVNANLKNAILYQANLTDADLSNATLEGANLNQACLTKAILYQSNMKNSKLRKAFLKSTSFAQADLEGAEMDGAHFKRASFVNAILDQASMENSIIEDTTFTDASLQETQLRNAKIVRPISLTIDQIKSSDADRTTILPDVLRVQ